MSQQQRIHERASTWTKPVVYKRRPDGMWWASAKDEQGAYHSESFHTHWAALSKAQEYAAGVYL